MARRRSARPSKARVEGDAPGLGSGRRRPVGAVRKCLAQLGAPRRVERSVEQVEGAALLAVIGEKVGAQEQAPLGGQGRSLGQRRLRLRQPSRLLEGADPVLDRARVVGESLRAGPTDGEGIGCFRVRVRPTDFLVEETALLVGPQLRTRPLRRAESERHLAVRGGPARRLRPGRSALGLRPSLQGLERPGQVAELAPGLREMALRGALGKGGERRRQLDGGRRVVHAAAVDLREARGHRVERGPPPSGPPRARRWTLRSRARRAGRRGCASWLHPEPGAREAPVLGPVHRLEEELLASRHGRGHAHDAHRAPGVGRPSAGERAPPRRAAPTAAPRPRPRAPQRAAARRGAPSRALPAGWRAPGRRGRRSSTPRRGPRSRRAARGAPCSARRRALRARGNAPPRVSCPDGARAAGAGRKGRAP